jgi:hypothetical protein
MQVRKRIAATTAIAGLAALAMAGSAQAHYSRGQITCPTPTSAGSASFDYTSFPSGPNVVNVDLTVDTLTVTGSGKAGFTGPTGRVSLPFTVPADGQPHNVVAVTSWQQDGGGAARVVQSCTLPVPPAPPVPPTPVPPTPTPVPPSPEQTCHLGTVCCPVCVTSRERTILAGAIRVSRRTAAETRYEAVRSGTFSYIAPRPDVMAANKLRFGVAFDPVGRRVTVPLRRRADGRLFVHVSQAGLLAVRGQYFNGTLTLRGVRGTRKEERRNWRLCMISDGDLDRPSNRLRD